MHRRAFLTALSVGLTAATASRATVILGPISKAFVANPQHIAQTCPNWCWAASAAMIFAAGGHPINQMNIVQATYGSLVCSTANTFSITQVLSKPWVDANGKYFSPIITSGYDAFAGVLHINNDFIIQELTSNRPILYCNKSHAMVLVSVDFVSTPMGPKILSAGVLDPWPQSPIYHQLTPQELFPVHQGGQMTYLASVMV